MITPVHQECTACQLPEHQQHLMADPSTSASYCYLNNTNETTWKMPYSAEVTKGNTVEDTLPPITFQLQGTEYDLDYFQQSTTFFTPTDYRSWKFHPNLSISFL